MLAGANGSFSFKISMGMTDPEALEAPRSCRHQPTQPNLPEAPESVAQHQQQKGHREELMMELRVGQGGNSPGQKRNCLTAINSRTADETCSGYPAGCCSASARSQHTASHRNQNHSINNKQVKVVQLRSGQKRSPVQGSPEKHWDRFWIWGEIS